VTALDWGIVAFALLMGVWGYRQGLIVGFFSLAGFVGGAFLGARLGPALLADGSESPYAPLITLAAALLIGGIAAVSLEGVGHALRMRVLSRREAAAVDAVGGALLLAVLGVALAWLFGVVALNAPGARDLRESVQRSAILRELNDAVPPSGFILNTLNRIDPVTAINGPDPQVGPPDSKLAGDPEVRAASDSVVRVTGTACGLGIEGSGWLVAPGLIVTNAHVVAGQEDTVVSVGDDGEEHDVTPVHYEPENDLALLRVEGVGGQPLPFAPEQRSGTAGATLGYPENGPFTITPARLGVTQTAISQDSYGRGPIRRDLTSFRGEVRSGNSGGPILDGDGRVLTTVFASTTRGRSGGYGVPNDVIVEALAEISAEVSTGPCT
jgi:S1-C subfamily serine protease